MGLLNASNLNKSFGTNVIFSGISFEVQENDRIGLVGINGSGKTTLLKLLTGELQPDAGDIFKANSTVLGYMEQHVCRDLDRSAYNEVLTVFSDLLQMEKELEEINLRLQTKPKDLDQLIERQAMLNDRFVAMGGLTCRSRARSALLGLGFDDEQMGMPIGVLSGGQKAKLQLAKMLLCGANLLLLDEPTNHLDISSVEWLEDFLRSYSGAYLVISHDRYFLDKITNRTFEMEKRRLTVYKGNYTAYLAQKEENHLAAQRKYDNTQKEIKRIEGIVAQQRQWNKEKNIKTAENKLKMIERLGKTLEKPDDNPESIHFDFDISQRGGNDVLTVENLALSFDGKHLFKDVNLHIRRRERVFLIGPNGCGKTSLLKTILGIYPPEAGEFRFGAGIDIGYYDQIQAGLHPEKTVIDEIWDSYPRMTQTEIRNALAVFLFKGDDVFKPVSALSGGERARVLLLRLMLSRNNFLLLDEPTNHLDIGSCEALEAALQSYEGTLLIVSHDRYLINKIADRIYYLDENGTQEFIGNYDEYLKASRQKTIEEAESPDVKPNEYKLQKERNAVIRKEKAEMRRYEARIGEIEKEISELEQELLKPEIASDYQAAMEITEKISALTQENDEFYKQWSILAQKYEE
ncbi:ABC-F type ribosomal protection protein [Caproiciproducens galactitolivorans]|uniref:Putative ABC transporter ATP-binding protein YheS n=1 Tax=Caproiciproducens galactitolivorans TaxID=642589 RepID=A0A4Z0YFK1_9FIRM|nr:ABC-F type ribosomal protection protein [Caproiciproducens galactitolivorans]QEY34515.1 ABC-F type ribosomal protection protein [Caproiciproducens galactitolivorans]TGJ77700.1 putative ABC transporter ATP-binding protein YheS [Caproiciproducens galactitolivorans]